MVRQLKFVKKLNVDHTLYYRGKFRVFYHEVKCRFALNIRLPVCDGTETEFPLFLFP